MSSFNVPRIFSFDGTRVQIKGDKGAWHICQISKKVILRIVLQKGYF